MSAVWTKALADLRSRRLQAVVVALVVLLSSLAGTMALSLLIEADAPYDTALAQSGGAHLTVRFDPSRVSTAQLRATSRLSSITAVGGPWLDTPLEVDSAGGPRMPIDVVGRADPGGSVDRLQVTGRWVERAGEIVLAQRFHKFSGYAIGDTVSVAVGQGVGAQRVVGIAAAVNDAADAWVTPAQAAMIHPATVDGKTPQGSDAWLVMYRLRSSSTAGDIEGALNQVVATTSSAAIRDSSNWLDQKRRADITVAVMIPFLLAFSGFALLASAMIVGNVVSGAIIAGYREIGIMKAIGFTPLQVVATLVLQMLAPATAGALVGVAGGVAASQPFLDQTAASFDLPQAVGAAPMVITTCFVGVLAIVLVSTLLPALRAGRMSAVEAITAGSSPTGGGGRTVGRLAAQLPLPRSVTLGITDALVRPLRSGMTMLAVAIGVTTVTFAVGLTRSLDLVKHALTRDQTVQVSVFREAPEGKGPAPTDTLSDEQTLSLIRAEPGTVHVAAENQLRVRVEGVGQQVELHGYRGESSWVGYALLSGRWFSGGGEAVAPQALLDAAHKHVGDSVAVSRDGYQESLRLVGVIFDQENDNLLLRADWSSLTQISPSIGPREYEVQVTGVRPPQYARHLAAAAATPTVRVQTGRGRGTDTAFLLIEGVLSGLALVLTGIALAGVFNTVVLNTREKSRDTAILRALGMTPAQVRAMVLASVALIGLLGIAAGIPGGRLLQLEILTVMGRLGASSPIPGPLYDVYSIGLLLAMGSVGMAVALGGAWLPAAWAARTRVSELLSAE